MYIDAKVFVEFFAISLENDGKQKGEWYQFSGLYVPVTK